MAASGGWAPAELQEAIRVVQQHAAAAAAKAEPSSEDTFRRAASECRDLHGRHQGAAEQEAEPWAALGSPAGQLLFRDWQPSALADDSDEDGLASTAEAESVQADGHAFQYEHRGPRDHEALASSAPPFDNLRLTKGELAQLRSCAQGNPGRACQSICTHQ